MNAIDVENISLDIRNTKILNDISFSVRKGTIHALIGNNGAGKTSLLRILLGFTPKFKGQLKFFGSTDIIEQRQYIGAVMDSVSPDEKKTISSYLKNICRMFGTDNPKFGNEILNKVGLGNVSNKLISKCSLGMVRRLMIGCALASKPTLLILDEPFNGIDPNGMNEMRLLLQQLKSENVTILITSHIISELLKVADTFTIINNGKVVDTISADNLTSDKNYKMIVRPKNPPEFVKTLKSAEPDIVFQSDSNDTIAIFEKCDLQSVFKPDDYEILNQIIMSEEDVLLWKMNSKQ